MKKRLILGDTHGHINTIKQIYEKEIPTDVILLGDYCDSFKYKANEIEYCWDELVRLRNEHKQGEFRMVIGNHDLHYMLTSEKYSGKNYITQSLMHDKLMDAWDNKILEPYIVDNKNKTIYSHAGITKTWCNIWEHKIGDEVNLDSLRFTFGNSWNVYGDAPENSFVWVRPNSLFNDKIDDYKQVVGHTHLKSPIVIDFKDNQPIQIDFKNTTEITTNGQIYFLDTLPFWYMVEKIDNNGNITQREMKLFQEFNKDYKQ